MSKSKYSQSYEEIPVAGELPPRQLAAKLRRMGDSDTADEILMNIKKKDGKVALFDWGPVPAWKHTSHQFGFIPLMQLGSSNPITIQHAGIIQPDQSLMNKQIIIRLDRLRVFQYPGGGQHKILFTFKARNEIPNAPEPVSFSQVYDITEGESAGIAGQPVFIGLTIGQFGVGFEISTVNVRNNSDQILMDVLDSQPFHDGLNLLSTVQPVIKPFTDITLGIAKMFATRNDNIKVQQVFLGLDFSLGAMGVRLSEGEYLVAQVPADGMIKWDEWQYNPLNNTVESKSTQSSLPYNYFVFRVSRI
jgi:hypothetical protein